MDKKKEKFIQSYKDTLGNVTISTRAIGVTRYTYYGWLKSDEVFKNSIASIDEQVDEQVRQKIEKQFFQKLV